MQQELFKIRDKRKKGWFFIDNEYLNGYARIFGAVGSAIYMSLCRHANNETQKCHPSIKLIGEELNINRGTVIKYIKLFEQYKIIEIKKGKRNTKQQWLNNEYTLLDKEEWIKITQVQPLNTATQVQPLTYPSPNDEHTQVQPLDTKETNMDETNKKERSNFFNKICIRLKNWNDCQVNPIRNFKPKNIINKYSPEKIEKLINRYGDEDNGFSRFLNELKV